MWKCQEKIKYMDDRRGWRIEGSGEAGEMISHSFFMVCLVN